MLTERLDALKRHAGIAATLVGLGAAILLRASLEGTLWRALVYLSAIGLSVLAIDAVLRRWPPDGRQPIVRDAGFELAIAAIFFVVGFAWLYARFVLQYQPPPGALRMVWLVLLLGCVFNGFLALLLIARRYGLADLGLRVSGLAAALPVVAIFAFFALEFTHASITWSAILADTGGSWLAVLATALSAAVPEEFFRFVWQTRAGARFNNRAAGWLLAAIVWATLHGPKDWDESHSIAATLMGVINILPLGLLWGYLTYRTRSILPSILLHATNLWGLQNLP